MTATIPALMLLSCGTGEQIQRLMAEAGSPLAEALGLNLGEGLIPLELDPGLPLAQGGHWAERLGSRRQCSLLLIPAPLLSTGAAAAAAALLLQWRVPLLGLVQWGGPWDQAARRGDGLPWLGWLQSDPDDGQRAALRLACALRWRQLRETVAMTQAAQEAMPAA